MNKSDQLANQFRSALRGHVFLPGDVGYPIDQAAGVFDAVAHLCDDAPDALAMQVGTIPGPAGSSFAVVCPTCGSAAIGKRTIDALLELGTPLVSDIGEQPDGESRKIFDQHVVDGRRTFMDTRWLAALRVDVNRVLVEQIRKRPSPLCSVLTHDFRGTVAQVTPDSTAFGVRQRHVVIEVLAQVDRDATGDGSAERAWVAETASVLDHFSLPGGYANVTGRGDRDRARSTFGSNAQRRQAVKHRCDPENVFASAILLPDTRDPNAHRGAR